LKWVDTIALVRRAFHIQGWSMKKIARDLHLSRNTLRKILRTDETDFSYERERQPMPRIGPWQGQLEQFLSSNANRPSRERLTLIRIFEELRGLGYEGGYDAVRRFAKSWSQNRGAVTAEAYVPLYYAPGEAYQFDWSHEVVVISGVTVTVKVAHVRLCHSRMMFVRAYMREIEPLSAIGPRTMARGDGL
jgi:transposase